MKGWKRPQNTFTYFVQIYVAEKTGVGEILRFFRPFFGSVSSLYRTKKESFHTLKTMKWER